MAPRYSRNPDDYPRAREDWDEREVVPPRSRFGGRPERRGGPDYRDYDDPDYGRRRGGADEVWTDVPPAASFGMAGWAQPFDEPSSRRGYGVYSTPRRERPDDDWQARDRDRWQGYGPGDGGRGGERGFLDRAADEVSSWFGDDDAERRREEDHRGRGPRNYTRSDARIEEDVNDRLTDDRAVDASDITVKVKDREVTLDGHVTSRRAKRRAEDCADSVSGVAHVQNNLRIREAETGTGRSSGTA